MVWNKRKTKITWDKKLTATHIKCKFHEVDKWSPNRGSLIIVNLQHFELFSGNNCTFVISCPFFRSKTNDLTSLEEKLQNQAKTSKLETQKKQDDILAKEKQIQQLLEKSKDLERRVAEFTNARSVEQEKQANSLEELKVTLCLKIWFVMLTKQSRLISFFGWGERGNPSKMLTQSKAAAGFIPRLCVITCCGGQVWDRVSNFCCVIIIIIIIIIIIVVVVVINIIIIRPSCLSSSLSAPSSSSSSSLSSPSLSSSSSVLSVPSST